MTVTYAPLTWADVPSTDTALDALNLNRIEQGVSDLVAFANGLSAADVTDSTATGRAVLTAASQAAARTAIGAGTSSFDGTYTALTGKPTIPATYSDLTGTVPTAALPPLAINTVTVVASQAAMLALTAERGDMAVRTDTGQTFVLSSDSPTTLADWKEMLAAGQVQSVAGKTGVVTLAKADVGLGSVDNTADTAKNVLSATKLTTARTINGVSFDGTANITVADSTKAPTTRLITAGTGLAGGGDLSADRTLSVAYGTAAGTALQGSTRSAASGVASLDASVHHPVAEIATGSVQYIKKDPTTGFWPVSYDASGNPVYTGGSASAGVRKTSRPDVQYMWVGPDPSPAIVSSGTGGMLNNVDLRIVTAA